MYKFLVNNHRLFFDKKWEANNNLDFLKKKN